jgi:hypothetical protein
VFCTQYSLLVSSTLGRNRLRNKRDSEFSAPEYRHQGSAKANQPANHKQKCVPQEALLVLYTAIRVRNHSMTTMPLKMLLIGCLVAAGSAAEADVARSDSKAQWTSRRFMQWGSSRNPPPPPPPPPPQPGAFKRQLTHPTAHRYAPGAGFSECSPPWPSQQLLFWLCRRPRALRQGEPQD